MKLHSTCILLYEQIIGFIILNTTKPAQLLMEDKTKSLESELPRCPNNQPTLCKKLYRDC